MVNDLIKYYCGINEGAIALNAKGLEGFGYDPIFEVDGYGVTMADMSEELKNSISHRNLALSKIISYVNTYLA